MYAILKTKLLLKAALLASAPLAGAIGLIPLQQANPSAAALSSAVTVRIAPGSFFYREAGDFARGGRPVNAPMVQRRLPSVLLVMKHQVGAADYELCVAAGACPARGGAIQAAPGLPVTGVSWQDATAYAVWYAARTGQAWRLPTDSEWAYFAGSRFRDDAVAADDGGSGFEKRWLAKYDQESYRQPTTQKQPQPFGSFGENERGIADLSGNVWEWTNTCFVRQPLGADGRPQGARTMNCGVRVVEGEHRSYVTDFIRDARAGGCAVGIPPANLGFRLVREDTPLLQRLVVRLKARLARPG